MTDTRIEFDKLEKETDDAYLIVIDDEQIWLPKSQVRMYPNTEKVYVPDWLALKKGLI